MQWRKLGKIFDPAEHQLANDCKHFAQSPQALVFDDFVRIYFSTRAVDPRNGKFLSHVSFVDFSKDLQQIIGVADKAVIPLGGLGCFDEHGIFPFNVLHHQGRILAYTCGWTRRVSVSVDTGIGLAVSRDGGLTFERQGSGPVLTSSLREPCLVGDAFVQFMDGQFHMWYIFGTGWKRFAPDIAPDRTYKIGHAVSDDGVAWVKEEARQIVPDQWGPDESQALPTVVKIGTRFHMFFCYRHSYDFRQNRNRGYRIGHAYSDDLIHWTRDESLLLPQASSGEWDADMQCYPNVFDIDGTVYMLYNGNEFGRHGFGAAVLEC